MQTDDQVIAAVERALDNNLCFYCDKERANRCHYISGLCDEHLLFFLQSKSSP